MSTLRATNIKHESSATNQIVLGADGSIGGTLGDTLAAKLDASAYAPGLTLITTQSLSAVSSVSVNNCFTSTYENYLIVSTFVGSGDAALQFRLRASGSDNSSATYSVYGYFAVSTTVSGVASTAQTAGRLGSCNTTGYVNVAKLFGPAVAGYTRYVAETGGNGQRSSWAGAHDTASAYDGFTAYPSAGTITGTIRVYGYKNS